MNKKSDEICNNIIDNINQIENVDFLDELLKNSEKLIRIEKMIKRFPIFRDYIIDNRVESDKYDWYKLGERYKDTPYNWGISFGLFLETTSKTISNYRGKDYGEKWLFRLYFNSISLFDSYNQYNLDKIFPKAFFYDEHNSTYYIEEKDIEEFLEKANQWYLESKKANQIEKNKEKIEKLQEQLKELLDV